ncbi:hypothetical protein Ahy_B04g073062 isoform A [Arachis hypogaea]|uniref:V-SNARE coiled-coil homology domain-containing protein n=1 Tax=Arachis hypogaea TaxID=3818 RepID=A0A444ZPK4_ARAHY|nr:hypothetical protein Ahy_B04g073062 isoform A [Arachis hypogaea]
MFAKKLLHKAVLHHSNHSKFQHHRGLKSSELDPRIVIHYGIPSTASVLAFDSIQRLLAIGTLDGRLKVIGGDNIEGILISPKQLPYKHLEFLQNQGYLVGVLNDNDIQIWSLESRSLVCSLEWESNITAFSVISGSHFIYVGDEHGSFSVVKFEAEEGQLLKSSYDLSAKFLREAAGFSDYSDQPIVGILSQPSSFGNSRLLIAFQDGLLILWDIAESKIVFVGGGKDLQLKDQGSDSSVEPDTNVPSDSIEQNLGDKEISALCWASLSGSILAVGYLDGDILFWNLSSTAPSKGQQNSSKNVVKLQLSSAERRLPVIVLQWSSNQKSRSDCDGQLFVYGGDEIGSEEVLTVLTLEWSSGMETVKCISRADLTLSGSFADLILLPRAGAMELNTKADLFVLTNPGQLHFYDNDNLSALTSQQNRTPSIDALEFPVLIPIADPSLTVTQLVRLPSESTSSKILTEVASVLRTGSTPSLATPSNWPLTGGVPSHLSTPKGSGIERVYFAGYSDGSVLVCDATHPVLSYICYIEGEVKDIKVAGSSAPVTKLDFCSVSLLLAIGNESGLVCIYDLQGHSDGRNCHFVTETKSEVHESPQGKGTHCSAVISLLGSPVQALSFSNSGTKLAIGYSSGRVAVCDMTSMSVLFMIDGVPISSSPITSMIWKEQARFHSALNSPKQSETSSTGNSLEEIIFILSRDGKINIVEGDTGKMISSQPLHVKESTAISIHVIEDSIATTEATNDRHEEEPLKDTASASPDEPVRESNSTGINSSEAESSSSEVTAAGDLLFDPLVLLCCENSLRLFSAKSLIQGNKKPIRKVKDTKSYYWTTILKKDDKFCGLLSLLQTGIFEIRSLPDLELVTESSLLSILRWNYKVNMDKTLCSDDNGNIALANGSELTFISLLAGEDKFRNLERLPCLHDKVLAAAADAAFRFSSSQKKKQISAPGILGGIVKGFKGGKASPTNMIKIQPSNFMHLEDKFYKSPRTNLYDTCSLENTEHQNLLHCGTDDIEIDEPITEVSTYSPNVKNKQKDNLREREKLFEGATSDDVKPRLRTPEEIMATYRKTGDASSAAGQARNKLVERQEKLERISQRTAELQSGAEDFASLANELVKTMERRKWWQI